ncbi:aspartate carbamoyltransferase [Candidatus Woesearchaeota archaeon]|jgi:aspartate carbamoyltransferase catalytic subunit|nr:aspartate carbamoyltransferase [Candidatus Woesearchaeota archaeon]MBT3304060.1 aspartate carbamoyltransferase [Candidatus Woesearchaeota archaeon]MBT4368642.1 aspartate carbamoyltransferase [Candidatus Woesearchaeota archaeon]MBT4713135.1 aspartate carbamoyltransferase [Candidatus Woesearchaeota archaeon]MBT6638971.1 aspartate carbamoyltransferase [Candidatus Woesearchaeota archaeon]
MKHVIESQQFDKETLIEIFNKAEELRTASSNILTGKVLATLFYEPSTRTRLSFESAMLKLGGDVIGTENASEFSSAVKGESLQDTIRIVSSYVDVIVLRHFETGSAKVASEVSSVPVINAGDGSGQHPTQAILDLYTIWREQGGLDNLTILMVGDLKYGRTVSSLCYLLGKFKDNKIIFISPSNLKIKSGIKEYLEKHDTNFEESSELNPHLQIADVIYLTRIQKERMSEEEYNNAKGLYGINQDNFHLLKESARLMHPLPHIEEICLPLAVEGSDKRVAYFRQAENGLYVRMALLLRLLSSS